MPVAAAGKNVVYMKTVTLKYRYNCVYNIFSFEFLKFFACLNHLRKVLSTYTEFSMFDALFHYCSTELAGRDAIVYL